MTSRSETKNQSAIDYLDFPEAIRIDARPWDRPYRVSLDGEYLIWAYRPGEEGAGFGLEALLQTWHETVNWRPSHSTADPSMLSNFMRLADAPIAAVLAFAHEWGALGFCRHGLPRTHPPRQGAGRDTLYCQDVEGDDINGREPVAIWKRWASRMHAAVRISVELRSDPKSCGEPKDWALFWPDDPPSTPEEARSLLNRWVQYCLELGLVGPRVGDLMAYDVSLGGPGTFATLAYQLLAATMGLQGWALCPACLNLFVPERVAEGAPQHGSKGRGQKYCSKCGRKAGWRIASAKRRQKRKLSTQAQ
jgi:hypothetical protein